MNPNQCGWGLFRRRLCLVPTWRGWLALTFIGVLVAVCAVRGVYPFLAVTDSVPGGVLVVEGWSPDRVMREAMAEYQRHHYDRLFVTGGPIEKGAPLFEYKTIAEAGTATLLRFGMGTNAVQAVPAPLARKDRTYTAALALRDWLRQHGNPVTNINVISVGPHARRTRLLFARAFGRGYRIGIIAAEPSEYTPRCWWRSSAGFRTVTDEAIAYSYARLIFPLTNESK